MSVDRIFTWPEISELVANQQLDRLGRLPADLHIYREKMSEVKDIYASVTDYIQHVVFGFKTEVLGGKKKVVVPSRPEEVDPSAVSGVSVVLPPEFLADRVPDGDDPNAVEVEGEKFTPAPPVAVVQTPPSTPTLPPSGLVTKPSKKSAPLMPWGRFGQQPQPDTFQSHPVLRLVVFRPNDFPYAIEPGVEHHLIWSTFALTKAEVDWIISKHRNGYECVYFVNPPNLRSVKDVHHVHVFSRRMSPQAYEQARVTLKASSELKASAEFKASTEMLQQSPGPSAVAAAPTAVAVS